MKNTEAKGNWNEQKFGNLTDNDLMFDEGKKDEMPGRVQVKFGKSKEEFKDHGRALVTSSSLKVYLFSGLSIEGTLFF